MMRSGKLPIGCWLATSKNVHELDLRRKEVSIAQLDPQSASKNVHDLDLRRKEVSIAQLDPQNAPQLVDMLAGGSSAGPGVARENKAGGHRVGIWSQRTDKWRPKEEIGPGGGRS